MRKKGNEHFVITSYETRHLLSSLQMCLISQAPHEVSVFISILQIRKLSGYAACPGPHDRLRARVPLSLLVQGAAGALSRLWFRTISQPLCEPKAYFLRGWEGFRADGHLFHHGHKAVYKAQLCNSGGLKYSPSQTGQAWKVTSRWVVLQNATCSNFLSSLCQEEGQCSGNSQSSSEEQAVQGKFISKGILE